MSKRNRETKRRAVRKSTVKKASAKKTTGSKAAAKKTANKPAAKAGIKPAAAGRRRIDVSKAKKEPVPQPASTARVLRRRIRLPTIEQIRSGLTTERLNELGQLLQVSDDHLSSVVRVPRATLNRRRDSGQLTQEEGDRTAIVMRVFAKAVDYFEGDEDAARRWMKHPAPAFGGETPLKRCDTSTGAQEVITLLTQLEYGIPA